MIERILISLLTHITSWLLSKGLEKIHGAQEKAATEKDIDARLKNFKTAYTEAFNGETVTPEQRAKLNKAIADFIRNPNGGGL